MAEEKARSWISGWVKAVITSIMGLGTGAVLMYVSPLVNNAIKPGKPVANFGQQVQGLAVVFQNRSTGGGDGWWDFGDGSALEPFSANQESITHNYPRPGTYTAKLSLRNFLGDENERAVPVVLDGNAASGPVIETFKVNLPAKAVAPITFSVDAKVKNADLCIWSVGDNYPIEVVTDPSNNVSRLVTIRDPGMYTVRLLAVTGKQTVEKTSELLWIDVPDANTATATLQVSYEASHVRHATKEINLAAAFPADNKSSTYAFNIPYSEPGFQILEAKFTKPGKDPNVKNPLLVIAQDKSKVTLSGELVKPTGLAAWQKNQPPIKWTPTIALTLESRGKTMVRPQEPVMVNLNVPGSTLLPMPKMSGGWEAKTCKIVNLDLMDGSRRVFQNARLPAGDIVLFKNKAYRVVANQMPDGIRLDISEAALRPIGN